MSMSPAGNTGPFSTTRIAVMAFVGARVLFAIPTSPALAGAILLGVAVNQLPPATHGRIRDIYASAKGLVRSRISTAARKARQIAQQANTKIRTTIVNGVLIITIWAALAVEIADQIIEALKVSVEVGRTGSAAFAFANAEV
jgi:DNA-directed RNA polymerase